MRKVYMGIDLGSKFCGATTIDSRGDMVDYTEFDTSERNLISHVSDTRGELHVMFEEGELAGWAYRTLIPHAERVVVCDPKRNAWIARAGSKSEPIDTYKLAEQLRVNSFSPVYHPEEDRMVIFRKAVRHYDETTKRVARLKNQVKAHFRQNGISITGSRVFGKRGRERYLEMLQHEEIQEIIRDDIDFLDHLLVAKARARARVISLSKEVPIIAYLKETPGIGPILASRFVAYIGSPYRFSNKWKFWAYCRLAVVKRSSDGRPLGREHLSRSGNGMLKDLSRRAFLAAMRTRGDNAFKTYYRRSQTRTGNPDHARLNTQRKILWVMLTLWKNGVRYSDEEVLRKRGQKSA